MFESIRKWWMGETPKGPTFEEVDAVLQRMTLDEARRISRSCLATQLWETCSIGSDVNVSVFHETVRVFASEFGAVRLRSREAEILAEMSDISEIAREYSGGLLGIHWGGDILLFNDSSSAAIFAEGLPGGRVEFAPTIYHAIVVIDWEVSDRLETEIAARST